ncbi:MAG: hypothetical protein R3C49_23565 [Planctomycetaceae bacterium]
MRLFIGEDERDSKCSHQEVTIDLKEMIAILRDAVVSNRSWLNDLADERVKISTDLYEVLVTYSQLRKSA